VFTRETNLLRTGGRGAKDSLGVISGTEDVKFVFVNCRSTPQFTTQIFTLSPWWHSSQVVGSGSGRPILRKSMQTLDGRMVRVMRGRPLAIFEGGTANRVHWVPSGYLGRAFLMVEGECAAERVLGVLMFLFWGIPPTFGWAVSFLNLIYSWWWRSLGSFATSRNALIEGASRSIKSSWW
jgi:hypothetical protein